MTENQIPYEQEEEINLVSLLFTVLHKYRQMAAAALVCAVLFAGVAVVKNISWNAAVQKAAEEGETAPRTSAQQTYEEDMVEYREAQNKRDTDVQSYDSPRQRAFAADGPVQHRQRRRVHGKVRPEQHRSLQCLQRQSGSVRHHRL